MHTLYLKTLYKKKFFCNILINPKKINYTVLKKFSKTTFEYYSILIFIFYLEYKTNKQKFEKVIVEYKKKQTKNNKKKHN